jgi:hypothetical protein
VTGVDDSERTWRAAPRAPAAPCVQYRTVTTVTAADGEVLSTVASTTADAGRAAGGHPDAGARRGRREWLLRKQKNSRAPARAEAATGGGGGGGERPVAKGPRGRALEDAELQFVPVTLGGAGDDATGSGQLLVDFAAGMHLSLDAVGPRLFRRANDPAQKTVYLLTAAAAELVAGDTERELRLVLAGSKAIGRSSVDPVWARPGGLRVFLATKRV